MSVPVLFLGLGYLGCGRDGPRRGVCTPSSSCWHCMWLSAGRCPCFDGGVTPPFQGVCNAVPKCSPVPSAHRHLAGLLGVQAGAPATECRPGACYVLLAPEASPCGHGCVGAPATGCLPAALPCQQCSPAGRLPACLFRCRLETIPRALSGLTALRVLYLHDCFTDVAPPDADFTAALGPLSQLGMLSLSSCRLRSVPSVVAAMTSLRVRSWRLFT